VDRLDSRIKRGGAARQGFQIRRTAKKGLASGETEAGGTDRVLKVSGASRGCRGLNGAVKKGDDRGLFKEW